MKRKWTPKPSRNRMVDEGKEILQTIHKHDLNYGGHFIEVTAGTGKGKTSMLLSSALYNLKHYPREKVFFSECWNTPIQSFKLGKDKVHFLFPAKSAGIEFRNRNKKLKITPYEEFSIDFYKDFKDLYYKAKYGKINVPVFEDRRDIMEFIAFLRGIGEFVLVLVDEMSEIATMSGKGLYQRNQEFATVAKDLRKCMVNVWYTAQFTNQIDYRVRAAVDIKLFGPGSKSDSMVRVTQKAIDNLTVDISKGNEFYIVNGGVFGLIKLGDIFEPKKDLNYELNRKAN